MLLVRLLIILFSFILVSCQDGKLNELSVSSPFTVTSRTILDYNATNVVVKFRGSFQEGSINALDDIQFFSDDLCQGGTLGSALKSVFDSDGIDISVSTNQSTDLYVSTAASSDCYFIESYAHGPLAPADPVFNLVSPPSPSRTVFTPGLFGTGFPNSGTIRFFDDAACTNQLAQGNVSDFSSGGIPVTVPQNMTTTIHAQIVDFAAGTSACVYMLDYTHSDALSDPPTLVSITPASPSNTSTTPTVVGNTAAGTVTVGLFSDSACSQLLVDGDPVAFASAGFQISLSTNSTITIYAKSEDNLGQPSVCALFGNYIHDDIPPADPAFSLATPLSPTNQTTSPSITGTSSADTETIRMFDSNLCLTGIGVGSKAAFESTGVSAGVATNATTEIYGQASDEAGNTSGCVSFTSYVHNTIPPLSPLFSATVPPSPTNASLTPLIQGDAAPRTVQLDFYKDENCLMAVGSGSAIDYEGPGIQVTADPNTTTSIYVRVSDQEGNVSNCEFHASYDHSSAAAPDPGFFATFPASPSNSSTNPSVIGTADSVISSITLYSDSGCSSSLGSGTRGQFTSSGIIVNLPANSTNDIYAQATDIYGNLSSCSVLTQYIHNTVPPLDPTFTATSPVSPNNVSFTPIITGTALHNPASQLVPNSISFFDSPSCVSQLGTGTPADFASPGLLVNVAPNALTSIFTRSFDAAGNFSNCTHLTDYIHNSLVPAAPQFISASPGSPSFSADITISGTYGSSSDFMNRTSIVVYDDSGCTNELTNANPALFDSTGVPVTVSDNAVTSLYGLSINEVGTPSACTFLTTFRHYDLAPTSVTTLSNTDGSITVNWFPDTVSSPTPTYNVERSLSANGPFSILSADQVSNSFRDYLVTDNVEYYYRVYASNSTGRSQNSTAVNETVMAPPSIPAASLNANGFDNSVTLTWSGFPQNMAYRVSRSTQFGGPFERIGSDILSTSYQDISVTNGQTYYYIVEATNPSGLSMRSNIASALPRVVPNAPEDFKITPLSSSDACGGARGVRASWTAPSYYSSFNLIRGNFKNTSNVVATPGQTFTDQCSLGGNTNFYYSVTSQWGTNFSTRSNTFGFHSSNAPSLQVFPGNGEIILDWNAPSISPELSVYTILYNVYKATDPDGDFTIIAADITSTLYTDTVANGDGGFYYVQAHVIDGDGDKVFIGYPTNVESGTAAVDPAAPTNLNLVYVEDDNRVQLDWSPPTHYNGFQVYHATSLGGPYSPLSFVNNTFLLSASTTAGMNYFKVTTIWGSVESADSNIVSFRDGRVTGLNATPSASDINLTWTSVATAVDYVVYRATDLAGPYASIGIAPSNSFLDSTASSAVGYYYKIKARFADATEGALSAVSSAMRTDSNAPASISLTVQSGSFIRADWPEVDGVGQYEAFRATSLGGPYTSLGTSNTNTFNFLGLSANTEYFFRIDSVIGMTNFPSAVVSAFTYTTPTSPSGVVGNNQIEVTWSAVAGVNDYDILRSSDGVSYSSLVTGYPTTNYVDLTATNGTLYFYKIQANFTGGQTLSDASIGLTPGLVPLAPSNLRAENNNTGTEVTLSWAEVSGTTRYNIYSSTTSGSYGVPIQSSTQNSGVRITGLTTDTVYYFVVTAVNGSQESLVSNEVSVVPQLEPAKPIAQYSSTTEINISWAAVPSAADYSIYRSDDGVIFTEIASSLLTTSYVDAVPDVNRTYFYKYRGFTAAGVEMSLSQTSDGTNLSIAPQTPVAFNLYANNTSEVHLEWAFVPNLQRYEIYRGNSSGGPYSLIASPLPGDVTYTDTTVSASQSYFYVIRAINLSGVPSPDSAELGIDLISGPANLNLVNGALTIDASWDVLGGVVSYNLRRSLTSGGPYGLIANVGTNFHSDSDIVADKTYYYVVEGVYADGRVTALSTEQSITRSGYLFLEVPVELTDTPMSSSGSSSLAFERTQTSFNTDFYDGVVGYEMEIVATNLDVVGRDVNLIDSSNAIVGTVTVPATTNNPTRIRAAVTPNVGEDIYRMELVQSANDGDLAVYTAKLLVTQQNASKTRLYFPLLSSDRSPSQFDQGEAVYSTSDQAYQDFTYALLFERETAKYKEIIDYNAWEIEAVVSTTGVAEGSFGLRNLDTNQLVSTTETRFSDNNIQIARVPFDEGVAEFAAANEGDQFRLDFRCEYNCSSGSVNLYKAGVWLTLENLAQAKIIHRINWHEESVSSDTDLIDERVYLDLAKYTMPQVYFQALVYEDALGDGSVELVYHAQDSGSTGLTVLPSSNVIVNSDQLAVYQSPLLSPITVQNYMTRVRPMSGELTLRSSSFVIEVGN